METKQSSTFSWILSTVLALLYILSLGVLLYGNIQAGDSQPLQLLFSGIILSIPLILMYGLSGVLISAARQARKGQIAQRLARWIYWSPRIAGIFIIFFISLFAMDVFEGDAALGEKLLAFLMHMIPSLVLILLLILAWRWEWIGLVTFLLAALFFMRTFFMSIGQPGSLSSAFGMLLLFSGPLLLIALLFGANWRWHSQLHRPAAA